MSALDGFGAERKILEIKECRSTPIEKQTYETADKEANDLRDDEDGHEH